MFDKNLTVYNKLGTLLHFFSQSTNCFDSLPEKCHLICTAFVEKVGSRGLTADCGNFVRGLSEMSNYICSKSLKKFWGKRLTKLLN